MEEIQCWGYGGPDSHRPVPRRGPPLSPGTIADLRKWHPDMEVTTPPANDAYEVVPEEPKPEMTVEEQETLYRRQEYMLNHPDAPWYAPESEHVQTAEVKEWINSIRAQHDPEDTRHKESAEAVESGGKTEPMNDVSKTTQTREKTSVTHRQSKSTRTTKGNSQVKKRYTRRNLGSSKDVELQQGSGSDQESTMQESSGARSRRGRRTTSVLEPQATIAKKATEITGGSPSKHAKTSKVATSKQQNTPTRSSPRGRPRIGNTVGRPTSSSRRQVRDPAKVKTAPTKQMRKVQKNSPVLGARVTKQKKVAKPAAAPSVHNMRTRAKGAVK